MEHNASENAFGIAYKMAGNRLRVGTVLQTIATENGFTSDERRLKRYWMVCLRMIRNLPPVGKTLTG